MDDPRNSPISLAGCSPRDAFRGLIHSVVLVTLVAGCGSSNTPQTTAKGNVVLTDGSNYSSESTLTLPKVQTKAGADLKICWDGVAKDILCHTVAPAADIDNVSFLQIPNSTEAQIQSDLASGQLTATKIKVYRDFHTDHQATCTMLSTLTFGDTALAPAQDYVEGGGGKYMLLFSKGTTPGSGARTMMFIEPTASSTNTTIAAPDGCASNILKFNANITSPKTVKVPKVGPWIADWSQITKDSMGSAVIFSKLDKIMVGFYKGMTVADLQTKFLDIEIIANTLYQGAIPLGENSIDLSSTKDASGASFAGFTSVDGVWAVALLCSTCQVPAPIVLSILEPSL